MWKCSKCNRIFAKKDQPHSCRLVCLDDHFKNKAGAKVLFNKLLADINQQIGHCEVVSLPCCIHLFGKYDFLAALPKKDSLEIRFALNRAITSPRSKQAVPLSQKSYKNCIYICSKKDIDKEFMDLLKESYNLKT